MKKAITQEIRIHLDRKCLSPVLVCDFTFPVIVPTSERELWFDGCWNHIKTPKNATCCKHSRGLILAYIMRSRFFVVKPPLLITQWAFCRLSNYLRMSKHSSTCPEMIPRFRSSCVLFRITNSVPVDNWELTGIGFEPGTFAGNGIWIVGRHPDGLN